MTDQISVINKDLDATIAAFKKIQDVAIYVSQSEAFTKSFVIKDKDGNVVLDEATGKPKINVADVALCLMAGNEMGLSLSGSLLYGRKLNEATYMAVLKGRSIGVDVATSLEKIISIPTKAGGGGYVSYTMVDIISAKLLQGGVEFLPFIKNYAPFYIYKNSDQEELELDKILDENDELRPEYVLINLTGAADPKVAESIKAAVAAAKADNKIVVSRERHGYYSKAKFTRKYIDGRTIVHYQRFSTVDAERAGLLPTYTWDDKAKVYTEATKGKDNWISNTPQMMNNRVISIGGRIIGADLLNGIYTRDEVVDAGLIDDKDAPIIDTKAEVM